MGAFGRNQGATSRTHVHPGRAGRAWVALFVAVAVISAACSSSSETLDTSVTASSVTTATTTVASTVPDSPTSTTSSSPAVPPSTDAPADAISVEILEPDPLTSFPAVVDLGDGRLGATVRLVASVDDAAADSLTARWESDVDGPLGVGLELETVLSNGGTDVLAHDVTVTVTGPSGGQGTASITVVVQVPSN